jgi:hypothetical protein
MLTKFHTSFKILEIFRLIFGLSVKESSRSKPSVIQEILRTPGLDSKLGDAQFEPQ